MEIEKQDPQQHANMAFWHIYKLDSLKIPAIATLLPLIPVVGILGYASPESFDFIKGFPYGAYLGVATALVVAGSLGEVIVDKMTQRKVNYRLSLENKLETKGLFRIERHPLYFFKTMSLLGVSLGSSNPVGFALGLKGVYHATRGCAEEEESLRVVYGEEYREYKKRTHSFVPRSKNLVTLIRKTMSRGLKEKLRMEPKIGEKLEEFNPSIGHLYNS